MSWFDLTCVVVVVLLALTVFCAVAGVLHPDPKAARRAITVLDKLLRFLSSFVRR
ncbi:MULTISPECIES: hypothetical protein [unclassified Streptomyces]|uniref:hypothetical protein n=1 Tax=unclassified Streptomyces TaxID=2593676 RepID=UPI00136AA7E8|nr:MULTISPECIES: hypothetical protein [unclassified Streptomyces]MYR92354.1 hypothetical protein [Streptomyces sp. SID4937]